MGKFWGKVKQVLKTIFFGDKTKRLPSGRHQGEYAKTFDKYIQQKQSSIQYTTKQDNYINQQRHQTKQNRFIEQQRNQQNQQYQKPKIANPYMEYALDLYFKEYLRQINEGQFNGQIPSSYSALTSINAIKSKSFDNNLNYNNYYSEQNLLDKIKMEKRYYITEQKNNNTGECAFYHIKSMNHQMPDDKNMLRIYLNCRDENVTKLVEELLDNNRNPNLYLKFDSEASMNKRPRTEKIVIYTDDNHMNQDIQNIREIKSKRPDLFVDSDKMNPFVQQFENTYSVIRQPIGGNYVDLYGANMKIPNSANTYIARIIQDSYQNAVREIARKDPKINFLLYEQNINNYNLYVQNYPYIIYNYHEELMRMMEANMRALANKNNIIIRGISTAREMSYVDQGSNDRTTYMGR